MSITILPGQTADLISPFPQGEIHRIFRWKHCYRTLSNSDALPQTEPEFTEYIASVLPGFSSWGIIDKHQLTTAKHEAPIVGMVALEQMGPNGVSLHFASSRTAFKLGLVDDALMTLLERVFTIPAILRVSVTLDDKNPAVKALLRRHGFRVEGVCRDGVVWRGEPQDLVWFGLTRRQWEADHTQQVEEQDPVESESHVEEAVSESECEYLEVANESE